jgi:hypothetical protein
MLIAIYSVRMPTRESPVAALSRYLDRLFARAADRLADQLAPRVAERLTEDVDSLIATAEVIADPELRADLRQADLEPDEDARSYEEIRRELHLA